MVATISERVARYLERRGRPARVGRPSDEQSDHLTLALEEGDEDTLQQLQGHSITYRIAMGPHAGRKVLTLQTIPAREEEEHGTDQLGRIGGFSLHGGGLPSNSRYRDRVTPVSSGKVKKPTADADGRQEPDLTASKRKGMCCTEGRPAQRLKRVFNIDVSICSACGGPMKIIASIEDPFVI
ncbi:MAG: hypothetical protein AB8B97_24870, partial [Granulosicoccus sp.]